MSKAIDDPRRDFLVRALTMGVFAAGQTAGLLQLARARGDIPSKLPEGRSIYRLQGVVTVDGRMVENLHVDQARRTLATADAIAALEG